MPYLAYIPGEPTEILAIGQSKAVATEIAKNHCDKHGFRVVPCTQELYDVIAAEGRGIKWRLWGNRTADVA